MKPRTAWIAAAATCAALAVVHTWPLVTAPGTLSRNDNGDTQLNEWILAWVAHQAPRAPTHLFAANIFYPARDTLAFSEPLIVPGLLGAPFAWLGASPVLVFNLVMLAGYALTALAAARLVHRWTGDWIAGLLAGSTFAFNTHTLTRLPHTQAYHIYGLPLALLAIDDIITHPRLVDGVRLALWMTVLAYTSGYLLVFASVMVAIAVVVRTAEWAPHARRAAAALGVAAGLAAVATLPLAIPYARVAREQHMVRSLELVGEYSATLKGYLAAAGTIHISTWSKWFFKDPVDSFFPGFVVIGLAIAGVWFTARARTRPAAGRVAMLVAMVVAGFVLSLGTATPVYGWLFWIFPPMQGLRAAARFGNLFLLGLSLLAGLGLAAWRQNNGHAAKARIALALLLVANLEALRAPFEFRRFNGIPPVYDLVADEPGPVVLAEVPFYPRQAVFENAEYVLNSTAHWRPLMNGYSGYTPESYVRNAATFWYFPEERAIQAMRAAGVTHVMVHPQRFGNEAEDVIRTLNGRSDFELMGISRGIRLYRLR
jgi:hypothetical protein